MSAPTPDRRGLIAGLAALGAAAPIVSRAAIVEVGGNASRLANLPDPSRPSNYSPPTRLSTIMDIYKRMTTSVKIAGMGPYQFVADTGANQSVVSAEVASKVGLLLGPAVPLNGVAGMQLTPTTQTSIEIGQRAKRQATLSVLPEAAIGAPGMLGLDLLDGARLTLDFARQTLTIEENGHGSGEDDEIRLKAHRRDGQLTLVDADLAGIRVTAFLDSGAQDTIGNMALRDLAVTRYPLTPFRPIPIVSVTGQSIDAQFADLPGLRIGGLSVPNWPVAFADLHTFKLWDLVDRPAILIGVDILSRFETVCLDFQRNEVRLRLPTHT